MNPSSPPRRPHAGAEIGTHTSTPPHIAPCSAPLHTETFFDRGHPYGAIKRSPPHPVKTAAPPRARRAKPGAKGAGKAEQSDRRAREDYGWGWAGGVTKPNHAPNSRPTPQAPAAAQAASRRPSSCSPTRQTAAAAARAVRRNPVSRFSPRPGQAALMARPSGLPSMSVSCSLAARAPRTNPVASVSPAIRSACSSIASASSPSASQLTSMRAS